MTQILCEAPRLSTAELTLMVYVWRLLYRPGAVGGRRRSTSSPLCIQGTSLLRSVSSQHARILPPDSAILALAPRGNGRGIDRKKRGRKRKAEIVRQYVLDAHVYKTSDAAVLAPYVDVQL